MFASCGPVTPVAGPGRETPSGGAGVIQGVEYLQLSLTVSTEVQRALARISSSLLVSSWPVHWRSRSLWNLYIHAYGPSLFDEPLASAMSAEMACDRSAEGAATRVPTIPIQGIGLGNSGWLQVLYITHLSCAIVDRASAGVDMCRRSVFGSVLPCKQGKSEKFR